MTMTIPKIHHTIWVGDRPAPMEWINTWKEKHPDWEHILWDNEKVFERVPWINQRHVDFFRERKMWPGVADVIRYEILCYGGGFAPGADSVCFENVDELFTDPAFDAYTQYENEKVTGELVSPLIACSKNNLLAHHLIQMLGMKEVVGEPWKTTGNLFMQHAIGALEYPRLKIWPSHFFLPEHHTGVKYEGTGKIYGSHMWGTGKGAYNLLNQHE
jgi:mannosyltransferase OCH1-like enzyme